MDSETAEARVLEAAETLFYARGVQAVGMAEIRTAAGVSLKRLYRLFSSKDALVAEFLRRHDQWRREALTAYVDAHADSPRERILAVFDWQYTWFSRPDFRGCAFTNCYGELGATSAMVVEVTRAHKAAIRQYLADLVAAAGEPAWLTGQLELLAQGAIVTAAIFGTPEP
ncbi:MAG: TetR/AcrR family transcriptional regulator, partial [Actinomadura sp.]